MWSSLSESDQLEAFNQLQKEEKRMRKDSLLNSNVNQLQGSKVSLVNVNYVCIFQFFIFIFIFE